MQCRTCRKPVSVHHVPMDQGEVSFNLCEDCRQFGVSGAVLGQLGVQVMLGAPSNRHCPHCDGVLLDFAKDLPGSAASCRRCGHLELILDPKRQPDEQRDPLGELLDAAAMLLRHQQQQRRSTQLPAAFHVENAQETDLKCPACDHALTRYRVHDKNKDAPGDFEICDGCFGIWLDREDFLHRPDHSDALRLEVDHHSIQPSSRICPKCRDTKLFLMKFSGSSVEIDCCADCYGTWLDGGELQAFCDYLGGSDHDVIDALVDNAVFRDPALCKTLRHFSRTLHDLDAQVREQTRNLDQARLIQTRLLFAGGEIGGDAPIPFGDYQVSRFWQPARVVGGDYFDLISLDLDGDPGLGICIADVSGKGLPASLLMANFQALLRAFAPGAESPSELCNHLSGVLYHNTTPGKYITAFYAVLDLKRHRLTYTNAGHNPPAYFGKEGGAFLKTKGTVLGLFPKWNFGQETIDLNPGDRILFYTDGVSEVVNEEEEDFGEERLLELLGQSRKTPVQKAHQHITRAVKEYCNNSFQDDATTLLLHRR